MNTQGGCKCCTRLALLLSFSLGTLHAQHPYWPNIWWKGCFLDDRYDSAWAEQSVASPYPFGWKTAEVTTLAQKGDACMQSILGRLYIRDVESNEAKPDLRTEEVMPYWRKRWRESVKWFLLAAEQGHGDAQVQIASYYWSGQYVRQDYVEAAKWYLKAADQGIPCAQLQLGEMYRDGQGVTKDDIHAHKWMNSAAADQLGLDFGWGYCVETAAKERDTLAITMTPAQIAEAQRLAREWKPHISPDPIPKRNYKKY